MAMTTLTEAVVEDAALAWLENLGWTIAHRPDLALGCCRNRCRKSCRWRLLKNFSGIYFVYDPAGS